MKKIILIGMLILMISSVYGIKAGERYTQEQLNTVDPWTIDLQCTYGYTFYSPTYDSYYFNVSMYPIRGERWMLFAVYSCLLPIKEPNSIYLIVRYPQLLFVQSDTLQSCMQNHTLNECIYYYLGSQVMDQTMRIRSLIYSYQLYPNEPPWWDAMYGWNPYE